MTRATTRPIADRLRTATAACADPETLARAVFDTVSVHVPFAFACLATTDPASGLITAAYKSSPLPLGDVEFAAAEYGAPDLNQFAEIARRPVPVGVLSLDTGGDPQSCRRMREYMTPQFGFTDELRVACLANGLTWGVLALYRSGGEPAFTAADARLLASAHEAIADGVRRTLFATDGSGRGAGPGPVVLIVDADDRVTDRSAAAEAAVAELGGWDHGELPASLLAVAATARRTSEPAETRVRGRSRGWLSLRAMALDAAPTRRSVVLTVDTAAPSAVGEMTIAARGLTAREQDVAGLVLQGASTKVIAATLHLSPHTVQDHLKAIFAKLGVSSRREMIAQLVLP